MKRFEFSIFHNSRDSSRLGCCIRVLKWVTEMQGYETYWIRAMKAFVGMLPKLSVHVEKKVDMIYEIADICYIVTSKYHLLSLVK